MTEMRDHTCGHRTAAMYCEAALIHRALTRRQTASCLRPPVRVPCRLCSPMRSQKYERYQEHSAVVRWVLLIRYGRSVVVIGTTGLISWVLYTAIGLSGYRCVRLRSLPKICP